MTFNDEKVFVIINSSFIGDILLTSTLIQNIKKLYLNSKVIMLTTSNSCVDIAKNIVGVDEAYFWNRKLGYKGMFEFIKNFPYKNIFATIPIYDNDRLAIFARLFNPKYVLSSSEKIISTLLMKSKYFIKFKKQNIQKQILNYLTGLTKEELINYPIKFNVPDINSELINNLNLKNEYLVLCPISSTIKKDMQFSIVKDLIENSKEQIVILGAGEQAEKLSNYLRENNLDNYIDLLNKTTLLEASYIIKNSKKVISVDTGLLHLACALNKEIIETIYDDNYNKNYLPDKEIYNVKILFNEYKYNEILNNEELNYANTCA